MWVKVIVFLLSIQIGFGIDLPRKCVSDLKINDRQYNVSEVYTVGNNDAIPTDAHYDEFGNLFYVKMTGNAEGYHYDIYILKSKGGDPRKVPGLPPGISYSIAIDIHYSKVYFGTGKGMYVYNYKSQSAVAISNKSITKPLNVVAIDKNSNKYVIENVGGIDEVYLLKGNKKIRFHTLEATNELAIDENNNFYYIREDKLCVLKATKSIPQAITRVNYNGIAQISFHEDNVFIANNDKLTYFHENDTNNLKVVENAPGNVTAIAFDKTGDFVLGVEGKILKYKKNDCYIRKNSRIVDEYGSNKSS